MATPIDFQNFPLQINQGASFDFSLGLIDSSLTPLDLTDCSASGKIRITPESLDALMDFRIYFNNPPTDGLLNISLSAAQTALLPAEPSYESFRKPTSYCYDIFLTKADGHIIRVLSGTIELSPRVTK